MISALRRDARICRSAVNTKAVVLALMVWSVAVAPSAAVSAPRTPPPPAAVQAYVVDPLSGGRLPVDPTPSPSSSSAAGLSADDEVSAFAARHPLFDLVRSDMAQLLRQGRAATLQSAYDQAVAARAASFQGDPAISGTRR